MTLSPGRPNNEGVVVLGSFVADVSFRIPRLPAWGETVMAGSFALGPGGKGSNQAVAAARAGASVQMLSKIGRDAFGRIAQDLWAEAGIDASLVAFTAEPTGAAAILIEEQLGENAILVAPGACYTLTPEEVDAAAATIGSAKVLLTQLELPLNTVTRGLQMGHHAGCITVLNPAPAPSQPLPEEVLGLIDFLIPNESEAARLTGLAVCGPEQAFAAAESLQQRGARHVIVTLGEQGALLCLRDQPPLHVAAFTAGTCRETTGAGDAFCGAFAAALSRGLDPERAVRFGCAAAGISVTRPGAATSMPLRAEIEALLSAQGISHRQTP